MFCRHCGMQLSDSAQFCSRCGASTQQTATPVSNAAVTPPDPVQPVAYPLDPTQKLAGQVQVLGVLWAVYSCFRVLLSVWGVWFVRAVMHMSTYTFPRRFGYYPFIPFMRGIFIFAGILSLITGILGIWTAVALLRRDRSGRIIAIVAACLALTNFPFGTGLGIYTLVVLLQQGASQSYDRLSLTSA